MATEELIPSTPTNKTKPPRVDIDLPEALTREEIGRIFDHLDRFGSFRDKVIFEFFLDTGCRVGEVANLTLDDIYLFEGFAKEKGKGRREGIVPMGAKLCHDLKLYLTRYRRAPEEEKGLFVSSKAPYGALTRDGIISLVKRVHRAVNIKEKFGPHKLRHSMATQFIANGGDVVILKKILRLSNINVTQRYINLVQNDVQEAHRQHSPLDQIWLFDHRTACLKPLVDHIQMARQRFAEAGNLFPIKRQNRIQDRSCICLSFVHLI
jgi:site-specific recombinase XerD